MIERDEQLHSKLVKYLQDALAMERNTLLMLDSMLVNTPDPDMRKVIEAHRDETRQHESRLKRRLDDLGETGGVAKQAPAVIGALIKGVVDQVRPDKPGKNARDAYVTEHVEIAAYELLERLAERVGDTETVEIARANKADEEAMAAYLAQNWDNVLELTLEDEGIATTSG